MPSTRAQVEAGSPDGRGSDRKPEALAAVRASRRWRSTELFGPAREIEIEHGQAVYRLRLTSLGKLILTK